MCIGDCIICNKTLYEGDVAAHFPHTDVFYCYDCANQPERSKREDTLCTTSMDMHDFGLSKDLLEKYPLPECMK